VSHDTLLLESASGALKITLNRPRVLNALSLELLSDLHEALVGPAAEPDVRAVLITGAGRGFSAGADLNDTPVDQDIGALLEKSYHPIVRAIAALRKPVIAGVNGVAAGAGLSLAAACDVRIASSAARFSIGFTGIGLVMDAGSSYFVPRLIGPGRTLELAFGNRAIDSAEALRIGLVESVVDADGFEDHVWELTKRLAAGPTLSYALVKHQVRASLENTLEEQLAVEAEAQSAAAASQDVTEGIEAFTLKRVPRFRGL
jgi:2-(1,2-epoxy-1,2-dihydrophenyl)acetyl-CoA isomerase